MKRAVIATTAGIALAVPMTVPAFASDHADETTTEGVCSVSARWELKAETDDGGVKIEFEVDSRTPGQSWDYVLSGPAGELASGTATTDDEGEFDVDVITAGSVTDAFTAFATTAGETCDSTVGIGADDDSEEADDDSDEGKCTSASSIVLTVDKSGNSRTATLAVKGAKKGQKWHYQIKRGNKIVRKGSARTKGKKASFEVRARTKGKGVMTADAERSNHSEECTTDDQYDD